MAASKVIVCGVGLIGGSFALAIKQYFAGRREKSALAGRQDVRIVGMGRTRAPLEQALQLARLRRDPGTSRQGDVDANRDGPK